MKTALKILLLTALALSSLNALNIAAVKELLNSAHRMVDTISPVALKQMIDDDEEFVLIDIREPDQLQRGEIYYYDLYKITRGYLEFKIEPIIPDKEKMIVVYCCTGKRSILASQRLKEMGYKNVFSLEGGLKGWVESGMPLDTAYGEMISVPLDYDAIAVAEAKKKEEEEAAKK
jgi:rhodanese-related sulfurtransferase